MQEKICACFECDIKFIPANKRQIYCSRYCQKKQWSINNPEKVRKSGLNWSKNNPEKVQKTA